MTTKRMEATISPREAKVLIDLIGSYFADREEIIQQETGARSGFNGYCGFVPQRFLASLTSAIRKLEMSGGHLIDEYDYWAVDKCDAETPTI